MTPLTRQRPTKGQKTTKPGSEDEVRRDKIKREVRDPPGGDPRDTNINTPQAFVSLTARDAAYKIKKRKKEPFLVAYTNSGRGVPFQRRNPQIPTGSGLDGNRQTGGQPGSKIHTRHAAGITHATENAAYVVAPNLEQERRVHTGEGKTRGGPDPTPKMPSLGVEREHRAQQNLSKKKNL